MTRSSSAALRTPWPALVEWVNRDRAFQSWLRQLKQRLDDWRENPADEGTLLRGGPLKVAEEWVGRRGGELNEEEKAFVAASAELVDVEKRRAEGELNRERARLRSQTLNFAFLFFALALMGVGSLGWHYVEGQRAIDARLSLVADLKKEIIGEPDLGVLIHACAKSGLQDSAGAECAARAESLSQDIVGKDGLEQSLSRQPELYAYVHIRYGAITELARQGDAYRAMLDDGTYFVTSFEKPVNPSSRDLKALPPCRHLDEMNGLSPAEIRDALRLCANSDLLRGLDVRPPAVGAVDDDRQFAVVSRCDPNTCTTTLSNLNVYRLSLDRRDARLVASLPGNFDVITMAASQDNVAVAYRSIGGLIRVKVYPTLGALRRAGARSCTHCVYGASQKIAPPQSGWSE